MTSEEFLAKCTKYTQWERAFNVGRWMFFAALFIWTDWRAWFCCGASLLFGVLRGVAENIHDKWHDRYLEEMKNGG